MTAPALPPGDRGAALPATVQRRPAPSILLDPDLFAMAQRAAKTLAYSPLFPEHLRPQGNIEVAIANGVLVLNIAYRMGEDPLTVAQNIYFVQGRPGWNASYMISRANQSGIFKGPIRWRVERGDKPIEVGPQKLPRITVTAYAKLADTGEEVSAAVSMETAAAEGWSKRGRNSQEKPSKYETLGEQMLHYRSATLLIRLYCPEVMLGYRTTDELEDIARSGAGRFPDEPEGAGAPPTTYTGAEPIEDAEEVTGDPEPVEEAEEVRPEPEPEPEPDPAPKPSSTRKATKPKASAPEPEPEPEPEPAAPTPAAELPLDDKPAPGAERTLAGLLSEIAKAQSHDDLDAILDILDEDALWLEKAWPAGYRKYVTQTEVKRASFDEKDD